MLWRTRTSWRSNMVVQLVSAWVSWLSSTMLPLSCHWYLNSYHWNIIALYHFFLIGLLFINFELYWIANSYICISCFTGWLNLYSPGGAMKPTTDGRWAHLACAIWIPGLFYSLEFSIIEKYRIYVDWTFCRNMFIWYQEDGAYWRS